MQTTGRTRPLSPISSGARATRRDWLSLAVVWAPFEPDRVGDVVLFPPNQIEPRVFGRGDSRDQQRRVELIRQRPGQNVPRASLTTGTVSREQLSIRLTAGESLWVENIGRCRLLVNGVDVPSANVSVGDVLNLEDQIVLLVTRRPEQIPPLPIRSEFPISEFGQADILGLVGESPAVWELRRRLISLARRESAHVLLLGSSGTGKELAARALHRLSARKSRPLISRNAATIPEGLVDVELFGNVRDFPNRGMAERPGLVGSADGSFLYLDEFGEMAHDLQAHLLRVMDSGEYHRLGDASARRSDFRFIGATNRRLDEIKHDIAARLTPLSVPDLNIRREDIPLLARHLLRHFTKEEPDILHFFEGGVVEGEPRISGSLMVHLLQRQYSTHVRELGKLLWTSISASEGSEQLLLSSALTVTGLPPVLPTPAERSVQPTVPPPSRRAPSSSGPIMTNEDLRILELFRRHGFDAAHAAKDPQWGVSKVTANADLFVLIARAMKHSDFRLGEAAAFLGGEQPLLREKIRKRIEGKLEKLQEAVADVGQEAIRMRLKAQHRGDFSVVELLFNALLEGQITRE